MRTILARPAGRWLASRQHSCNRCEEIASVKAGREALRFPFDIPAARASGAALNQPVEADDLHIAPFREDGVTPGTPTWIWSVAVGGDLYVRGYNGQGGDQTGFLGMAPGAASHYMLNRLERQTNLNTAFV